MTDEEIREAFLNLDQAMTSQTNAVTSQVQTMIAQVHWEVGPRVTEHANTMDVLLKYFTIIYPNMFFDSRSDDNAQDFLDEIT